MHARLDLGAVRLLTRTGLDWTRKYPGHRRGHRITPGPAGLSEVLQFARRPAGTGLQSTLRWRETDSNF